MRVRVGGEVGREVACRPLTGMGHMEAVWVHPWSRVVLGARDTGRKGILSPPQ